VEAGVKDRPERIYTMKETEDSRVKFSLDIWCENQHGNKVFVGTAMGWI
jgi:hypothetical protein